MVTKKTSTVWLSEIFPSFEYGQIPPTHADRNFAVCISFCMFLFLVFCLFIHQLFGLLSLSCMLSDF